MAVDVATLRRYVVATQGFGREETLEAAIGRLSAVQIDPLAVVERSHRVVLASRIGPYDEAELSSLLAGGRVFEYWAHELCFLPVDVYPLVRWRFRDGARWRNYDEALRRWAEVAEFVVERLGKEGPLPSRSFAGDRECGPAFDAASGVKPASIVLAALLDRGVLVSAGRIGGQRVYGLAERVLPPAVLNAPEPPEPELLRELSLRAVRARGALTEAAIREHWRLKGGRARLQPELDVLVAAGELCKLAVDDGGPPVYVDASADLDAASGDAALLLSPFDNMLWDRPLTQRLFGFDHIIEIYKPARDRRYGYYVLPLLWRDRIVGRADLKSDRKAGELRVLAFHREAGVRASARLDAALQQALSRLAGLAGLASIRR